MGVSAARKELLGQRDGCEVGTGRLPRRIQRTRTGRQNPGFVNRLLHADGRRTGEHVLMTGLALASKGVIGGILRQRAAEIGFSSKVLGRSKTIEREITPLRAFEGIVTFVTDVGEPRTAYACRQGEDRDFAG